VSETSEITRPLCAAIKRLPGCRVHRLHSGSVKVRGGYLELEDAGTPDVLALLRGAAGIVPIYFETKTNDGKLRPSQQAEHAELRRLGFRVEVPRSLAEAMTVVKEILEARR
jgi:hypothetical protein